MPGKYLKERNVTGEVSCFSWSWPRQKCFMPWVSTSLMGQMLVSANPFKWNMLVEHSAEGSEVFLEMLLAGVWGVWCTERKGPWIQSAQQREFCRAETCGTGCAVTHPSALALQLWLTAGRYSALPFLILLLSLQCVSNPSTSPQLHLTPITQITKLLYLGLSSIFVFDNYGFWAGNNTASLWKRVHSWFV